MSASIDQRVSVVENTLTHQDKKLDNIVIAIDKLTDAINAYRDHSHKDYEHQLNKLQKDINTIFEIHRGFEAELKISEKLQDKMISDQNLMNANQEARIGNLEVSLKDYIKTISNRTWGILISCLGSILSITVALIWYIITH